MELFMFYRKVAKRTGWWYVLTNFRKLRFVLLQIKEASEKFSLKEQYKAWIEHTHLAVSISTLVSLSLDYKNRKGQNYQNSLKKVFGVV